MSAGAMAGRRRPAVVRGLLLAWSIVVELFDHVLAEPYREGRLRATAWPVGLRTIVVIALCGYGLAVLGIVLSGPLRESLELSVTVGAVTLSFPRPVLWVLLFLVVFAMALLQTAALHVSWWLASVITVLTVLVLLFGSAPDTEGLLSPGRIVTFVVSIGLIVLTVLRRRRAFAWWEFAVILLAIGLAVAVTTARGIAQSAPNGIDFGPTMLSLTMSTLGQLAVPAAIAAGAAVAELSASTAVWAVGVIRKRLPPIALVIGLAILIVWRVWVLGAALADPEGTTLVQYLSSVLLLAAIAGLWYLLARLRGGHRVIPGASRLVDRLGAVATPIAAGLAMTLGPVVILLLLAQILFAYGVPIESIVWIHAITGLLTTSNAVSLVRLLVGIGLVVIAFVVARRGRRTVPELIGSIGIVTVTVAVAGLFGLGDWLWASGGLTSVATVGCLALLAAYAIRRTLTTRRLTGIAVALLLAAFFDQRDFVSDPLGAVLGFTGVAFVLFGFVWSFLTGGESANETSKRYPRPARVLLFLANSVFGVTVLAFTALARDPNASINLGGFAEIGDQLFGTGLLVGALVAVLAGVATGRPLSLERSEDHQAAGR
jgi:hypothetical protein